MSRIPKYKPDSEKSAADILGPWKDPGFESGLVCRVRKAWDIPITQLSSALLAMFLRQKIAVQIAATEARRRLESGYIDGTELYDEELRAALTDAESGETSR